MKRGVGMNNEIVKYGREISEGRIQLDNRGNNQKPDTKQGRRGGLETKERKGEKPEMEGKNQRAVFSIRKKGLKTQVRTGRIL